MGAWLCLGPGLMAAVPAAVESFDPSQPILSSVEQVRRLPAKEAQAGHTVRLEGTVTYSDPDWGLVVVQDATGGMCLEPAPAGLVANPGDRLWVEGTTGLGRFSPVVVRAREAKVLKKVELPVAQPASIGEVNNGAVNGQWVEIRGIVQFTEEINGRLRLELVSGLNRLHAWILLWQGNPELSLTDAEVRLRGVAGGQLDDQRTWRGFQLYSPSLAEVTVVEPPAPDAFARPVLSSRELRDAPVPPENGHRVHVQGIVTLRRASHMVFLRDSTGGLFLKTVHMPALRVGERVDAVGFLTAGSRSPQLESAVVKSLGMAQAPLPRVLERHEVVDEECNYELIQAEARLIERQVESREQVSLILQIGNEAGTAFLQSDQAGEALQGLLPGSRLRVTGVCQLLASPHRPEPEIAFWLRSPGDVEVLSVPLTEAQLAAAWSFGSLSFAALLGGATVLWVRRRGRQRIRQAIEASQRELTHQLKERERMGQNLHDNIMPSIYAVGLGLEHCRRIVQQSPEQAEERIAIATRALNGVIRDVRQFIGGLEPTVADGQEFSSALRALALASGASSRIHIHTEPAAARALTPQQATQLLNVAKEAVNNSLRHARARQTCISLTFPDQHVRLEIADDGVGYDPRTIPPEGRGLRNLAARARELGARCQIHTARGQGTRVVLDLPSPTVEHALSG